MGSPSTPLVPALDYEFVRFGLSSSSEIRTSKLQRPLTNGWDIHWYRKQSPEASFEIIPTRLNQSNFPTFWVKIAESKKIYMKAFWRNMIVSKHIVQRRWRFSKQNSNWINKMIIAINVNCYVNIATNQYTSIGYSALRNQKGNQTKSSLTQHYAEAWYMWRGSISVA